MSNVQIKEQVYALYHSNRDEYLQIDTFRSLFSPEQFPHLREYGLLVSPHCPLYSFNLFDRQEDFIFKTSNTSFPNLHTLSILNLSSHFESFVKTTSITKLTVTECTCIGVYRILSFIPMLKYLRINIVTDKISTVFNEIPSEKPNFQLKELIIDRFLRHFAALEKLTKRTPNLKCLIVSIDIEDTERVIDADRCERLITSSLPRLNTFKLVLNYFIDQEHCNLVKDFQRFQDHFWQNQHHWFIECVFSQYSLSIYTIPHLSHTYQLQPYETRWNQETSNKIDTFVNVTDLRLYRERLTDSCEYYFPNVTSLDLVSRFLSYLEIEHIQYLKKIVNLINLQHLDISNAYKTSSLVLLKILKRTPKLFSLTITWNELILFLTNEDLSQYFSQMIKILQIKHRPISATRKSFDIEQFCEVFRNLEHLDCNYYSWKEFVFLLNHLSKLSTAKFKLMTEENDEKQLARIDHIMQKLNGVYKINVENPRYANLCLWIVR